MAQTVGPNSLGGLFRAYGAEFLTADAVRATVVFTERSSSALVTDAPVSGGVPRDARTYRADIERAAGRSRTEVSATSAGGGPHLRVAVVDDGERWYYSVDRVSFGRLEGPADVFSIDDYARGLDAIAIADHDVTFAVRPDGLREAVCVPEVDRYGFAQLLALTGSDTDQRAHADMLEGFGICFTKCRDLTVGYSWSVPEDGNGDDSPRRADCEVLIRCFDAGRTITIPEPAIDPSLPTLRSLDDVWVLARQQLERLGHTTSSVSTAS